MSDDKTPEVPAEKEMIETLYSVSDRLWCISQLMDPDENTPPECILKSLGRMLGDLSNKLSDASSKLESEAR